MKKTLTILIVFFIALTSVQAQNTAKLQSIFIYNFIKLIEWPASANASGTFDIAVIGNDPIIAELTNLAKAKKAGSLTIKVTKASSASDAGTPHIIYVPKSQSGQIGNIKASVGSKPVLIISDTDGGTTKGADINFVIVDNKPKFEITPASAPRCI
jgi:hypothetical protein